MDHACFWRATSLFLARSVTGIATALLLGSGLQAETAIGGANGLRVSVKSNGSYNIALASPAWSLGGDTGAPLLNMRTAEGTDALGAWHEISFNYSADTPRHAAIRTYADRPVVLFTVTYLAAASNTAPFPTLTRYPTGLKHVTYAGSFALPSFPGFGNEGPWVFFDSMANTFILSPASNFLVASTAWDSNSAIATGISPNISSLPANFSHQTILVCEPGINRAFETWGHALTDLQGKTRPANDADVTLNLLGYWTDNGAMYYYSFEPSMTYQDTLSAVKAVFDQAGIQLGYMQLDSWFYPKGPTADWRSGGGIYQYRGAEGLFSPSVQAFQQGLGIPLVTHARWIDPASPYRQQYRVSGNVAVDPSYWDHVANFLAGAGVAVYEQDWLGDQAHTDFNLADPYAFLDNMATATAQRGIHMQYCMATPRDFLQSTRYNNLTTIRTSEDRCNPNRWSNFLYSSRLASALGIWPFTDVFMSGETYNLLLAALSAGPVGVGDRIGNLNAANLLRAVRPDGVIVKPDVPVVPLDRCYWNDAQALGAPMVASTYSDFGGLRAYYVFTYTQGYDALASFSLADLGAGGPAYVYNYFADTGTLIGPNDIFSEPMANGRGYYIVAPVGPSGVAMLGDRGNFVSLGKKRVTALSDDGTVHLTIAFAAGEASRTIQGYAPAPPNVSATAGSVGAVAYDSTTQRFTADVMPGSDQTASVDISVSTADSGGPGTGSGRLPGRGRTASAL